jgi:ribose transport system permease protein
MIAVLLLGTGITGLQLAGAPAWARDMFVGIVLIASLAVTGLQRRSTVTGHNSSRPQGGEESVSAGKEVT